jgi:hypothetical protein
VKRLKLLLILAAMPSEAFGWLVITLSNARGGQVWPTGLGGFRPDSRASIEATRAAADELLEQGEDV